MLPEQLLQKITTLNPFFFPHSRSHRLKNLSFPDSYCFIKREDELGGLCNGSKIRKYYSLIPHFVQQKIEWIILKGGTYSNALAALVPLLIEKKIKPILFLRGESSAQTVGNLFYLRLFSDPTSLHWVSRDQWEDVDQYINRYRQQHLSDSSLQKKGLLLPEGASCKESLLGSLTLALDIINNEKELNLTFDHIFIEAGTGGTAIALILGLKYLGKQTHIHVLSLTKEEELLKKRFSEFYSYFTEFLPFPVGCDQIDNYTFYSPQQLSSFGVVSPATRQLIRTTARQEGILLDPIYAARLWMEAPLYIQQKHLTGNLLFVHNGGTLSTLGYQQQFLPLL